MINYSLLTDLFRLNRDYTALTSALTAPVWGRRKPYVVNGLSAGAEHIFTAAFAEDFASSETPPVLLYPDEKRAVKARDFLLSLGVRAAHFPPGNTASRTSPRPMTPKGRG